jgi:hypothetical protein
VYSDFYYAPTHTFYLPPCRYNELMSDVGYVDSVLAKGAATANETAQRTLDNCKDAMGFVVPGLSK